MPETTAPTTTTTTTTTVPPQIVLDAQAAADRYGRATDTIIDNLNIVTSNIFGDAKDNLLDVFREIDGMSLNGVELYCCYQGATVKADHRDTALEIIDTRWEATRKVVIEMGVG